MNGIETWQTTGMARARGGLPSNYLVVGNLTLQTEGLDLNEDGVELKTIS